MRMKINGGFTTLLDEEDLEIVSTYRWWRERGRNTFYVRGELKGNGKSRRIYLHRFLLGILPPLKVDHIDGDGLNNQRLNLRAATNAQNGANSRPRKPGTSRFRGVSLHKKSGLWRAQVAGTTVGYFKDELDAARKYNVEATVVYGEFAVLNEMA